ncbi:MAG TPA: hypothetical protein DHW71_00485 [Gammaproteobacteria bacterium]|nr:hypothetical protein [Gammaproteobacteria bacterium]HBF08257.1 hypothetical protein [Gammaproteobacteria bacterium]HCK91426.1 hypothetical protein [Gammaproteobacteria bacterium]|tara:strand:+ start:54997 stop:55605 length:609 start_codon:yes stop_codon:yes gene_type:complete
MSLIVIALLSFVMLVTRFPFGGEAMHLLDASWAIFFILGRLNIEAPLKLVGFLWFATLAWGIDVWAVQGDYTSAYCMTTAYLGMPVAYAALTMIGGWSQGQHIAGFTAGHMTRGHLGFVISVALATFAAFIISNFFFFQWSGYFETMPAIKFAESVARYYPHYLLTTFFYVALWHIANRFISLESDVADAELQSITQESNND